MKKFFVMMYAVLIMFGVSSCLTTKGPPSTQPVVEPISVKGNIGMRMDGSTAIAIYTDVLFQEDAFLLEQFVLSNKADRLVLHLFNPGGSAFILFDVVDTLERLSKRGVHIITVARGTIASAAVPIFVMGDDRFICKGTYVMMHPGGWKGKESYVPKTMMKVFVEIEIKYAEIISSRTHMPNEMVLKILNHGCTETDEYGQVLNSETGMVWYNHSEAISWGIATQVYDNQFILEDAHELVRERKTEVPKE